MGKYLISRKCYDTNNEIINCKTPSVEITKMVEIRPPYPVEKERSSLLCVAKYGIGLFDIYNCCIDCDTYLY